MKSAPTTISQRPTSGASDARRSGGVNLIVLWTLYTLTLRQHMHGKRWMVVGVLFLLPAGLAILLRVIAPNVPSIVLEFLFAFMLIPQALLPLLALLYASGMIQDEQEEQTITYLLIRPLPRWGLYTVKLLATLTTTIVLTVVFTGITYAAIYLGSDAPVEATVRRCGSSAAGIQALAVATYCCLFGLLSLLTKRTLIVGILYSVIIEGVLANLPFGVRLLTVIYYARLIAYRTFPFIEDFQGRKINLAADAWQFNVQADPNLLEHPTGSTCITVLLATCAVSTVLAAIICSRREFHVKTPE